MSDQKERIGRARPRNPNRPKSSPIAIRLFEDQYTILVRAWRRETKEKISFTQWITEGCINDFVNLKKTSA